MVGEDYRAWAVHNHDIITEKQQVVNKQEKKIEKMESELKEASLLTQQQATEIEKL